MGKDFKRIRVSDKVSRVTLIDHSRTMKDDDTVSCPREKAMTAKRNVDPQEMRGECVQP